MTTEMFVVGILCFMMGVCMGVLVISMKADAMHSETLKAVLWFCMNAVIIAAWVYLAVHFDKWWIALFSILSTYSYKVDKGGDAE